jgi:hypothetical protein
MKLVNQLIACLILAISLWACKEKEKAVLNNQADSTAVKPAPVATKPGSSFLDSIQVTEPAAIFYYPDSLQDVRIKAITEPAIYNSSIHEMFYQMRNAKIVIKKTYPHLKIIEVTKSRFIQIKKKDGTKQIIDLDQYNDARGLIMSKGVKQPQLADMTNIDTELYRYFKEGQ